MWSGYSSDAHYGTLKPSKRMAIEIAYDILERGDSLIDYSVDIYDDNEIGICLDEQNWLVCKWQDLFGTNDWKAELHHFPDDSDDCEPVITTVLEETSTSSFINKVADLVIEHKNPIESIFRRLLKK